MDNPCTYCQDYCWFDETCSTCYGRGYTIGITVGLGMGGLMPAYAQHCCSSCQGTGAIRLFCQYWRR